MRVYCVNLNPLGENEAGYRKIKQECISACLKSYFLRHPEKSRDTEIISFAYRYKAGHEDIQPHYVESLMQQAGAEGAVLIFMSLDAIRTRSVESTSSLLQRCVERYNVAAVYLPFLSMEKPFDEYWREYLIFAHDKASYRPGRKVPGPYAPKEIREFIELHRGYDNFVLAADLEKYTGIKLSAVRSMSRQYNPNKKGRPITKEEIDEIAEIRKRHVANAMKYIEIFPD